jgi:hypothetical protein
MRGSLLMSLRRPTTVGGSVTTAPGTALTAGAVNLGSVRRRRRYSRESVEVPGEVPFGSPA